MIERPLITIKEARKILGAEAKALTDEDIVELIGFLTLAAREYIRNKYVH